MCYIIMIPIVLLTDGTAIPNGTEGMYITRNNNTDSSNINIVRVKYLYFSSSYTLINVEYC